MEQEYTYIDLFAGCGGLSLGLCNAGWHGFFAVEKNKDAFSTLKHNLIIKKKHFSWPDWLKEDAIDIYELIKNYKNELESLKGKIDLVVGGPPCQGFSMAGKRIKDDARNELVTAYIEFIDIVRPKILFLENVKNLLSHDKGKTILTIVNSLKRIGYTVFYKVINSADFGVPQARKRIYIIAFRNDLCVDDFTFPKGVNDFKCLEDILVENVSNKYIVNREYTLNKNALSTDRKKELIRIVKGIVAKENKGELTIIEPIWECVKEDGTCITAVRPPARKNWGIRILYGASRRDKQEWQIS